MNTCPPRSISFITISRNKSSLYACNSVVTGWRLAGGVLMIDKSRAPINEKCNVRGMGVAVRVSVSTFVLMAFSFSLAATPNFCSSSIMSNPKSLYLISLLNNLCVPIKISTLPSLAFCNVSFCSAALLNRLI